MPFPLFFLNVLVLFSPALSQLPIITSPSFCLTFLDCPSTQFCNSTFRCSPRLLPPLTCSLTTGFQCADSNHCAFLTSTPQCQPQAALNSPCNPSASAPCLPPNICLRSTRACQPFQTGFLGDLCALDNDCQQTAGFYCNGRTGRCARKFADGKMCGNSVSNNECSGICVDGDPVDPRRRGKCAPTQKVGGKCRENRECEGNRFLDVRFGRSVRDRVACNVPQGDIGRCIK